MQTINRETRDTCESLLMAKIHEMNTELDNGRLDPHSVEDIRKWLIIYKRAYLDLTGIYL